MWFDWKGEMKGAIFDGFVAPLYSLSNSITSKMLVEGTRKYSVDWLLVDWLRC